MTVSTRTVTISTVAGSGEPAHAGDGGPATSASLNEPKGVAVDRWGNLFIADSENHAIRQVDRATGIISTVAGRISTSDPGKPLAPLMGSRDSMEEDPLADQTSTKACVYRQTVDATGTVRYVINGSSVVTRFAGDGGPATNALLTFPSAVVVDREGHLYIADTMNHRIRRVDADTGVITTVAGTGQPRFFGDGRPAVEAALHEPVALALDLKGASLYVADQRNNRVRRVDLRSGMISTVAGTGESGYTGDDMPATEAGLSGPSGLALGLDALYVADTFSGRIRRIDFASGLISTVAGDGGEYRYQGVPNEISTSLSRPYGIALDRMGHLLITDSDSHLIRLWDRTKKIITRLAGNGQAQFAGDGGDPLASSLSYPFGVAVDDAGAILVADTFNHRIRKIAATP
jgi:DNA-binding beta-propeller fold protein YncE